MTDIHFGDFFYRLIRERGMTMQEFAQRAGTSASTLSRLRTGKRVPKNLPVDAWAEVLQLSIEEREQLQESIELAQAPTSLRKRIAHAEALVASERVEREQVEEQYNTYRQTHHYFDGYWLAYNYSFLNDGRLYRSLVHISGSDVMWLNKDNGAIQYNYRGTIEMLGDKIFVRLHEEHSDTEYVQVTLNSLFNMNAPVLLYGLASGISAKNIRHPVSFPVSSRMALVYIGDEKMPRNQAQQFQEIEDSLGAFIPSGIVPFYPEQLGSDEGLRTCLELRPKEDLDAVLIRLLDNHIDPSETVLWAGF